MIMYLEIRRYISDGKGKVILYNLIGMIIYFMNWRVDHLLNIQELDGCSE